MKRRNKLRARYFISYRIDDKLLVNGKKIGHNNRIKRNVYQYALGKKQWLYESEKEALKVFMNIVRGHNLKDYKEYWLIRSRDIPNQKTLGTIAMFYTMYFDKLGNKYERIYSLVKNVNSWANGYYKTNVRSVRGKWNK